MKQRVLFISVLEYSYYFISWLMLYLCITTRPLSFYIQLYPPALLACELVMAYWERDTHTRLDALRRLILAWSPQHVSSTLTTYMICRRSRTRLT